MSSEREGAESDNIFFTGADFGVDFWQTVNAKRKYVACTVFWTLAALSALSATLYFSYTLILNYLQYESYNQISQTTSSSLVLPAFTICNLNMINITNMEANMASSKMALYNELLVKIAESSGAQLMRLTPESYKDLDGADTDMLRDFSVQPAQELLINREYDYRFGANHYRIDFENDIHSTELGYCIDFNDDSSLVQYSGGMTGGFEIDLDIMVSTYSQQAESVGLLLFLRDQNETLLVNDGGIVLRPGTEHFVRIQKEEVTRLSGSYGTCRIEHSNMTRPGQASIQRSVRECKQDIRFELMAEICRCLPYYLYEWLDQKNITKHTYFEQLSAGCEAEDFVKRRKRQAPRGGGPPDGGPPDGGPPDGGPPDGGPPDGGPPAPACYNDTSEYECSFAEQMFCNGIVQNSIATTVGDAGPQSIAKLRNCFDLCEFVNYQSHIMTTDFPPTEKYHEVMLRQYTRHNYTFSESRANLLRIHVYYDDLTVTMIQQTGAYDVSSFIAELGGTFDLFIGVSIFSVLQLGEILLGTIISRVLKRTRPESEEKKHSELEITEL